MTNGLTIIKANRYFKNDTQDANIIAKHKKGNRASKRKRAKFLHFVMARCICTHSSLSLNGFSINILNFICNNLEG